MTQEKPEMQVKMQTDLGLEDKDFGYYATDLYVVAKPGVREWIQKNHPFPGNVTTFVGNKDATDWNGANKMCFDIPFYGYPHPRLK